MSLTHDQRELLKNEYAHGCLKDSQSQFLRELNAQVPGVKKEYEKWLSKDMNKYNMDDIEKMEKILELFGDSNGVLSAMIRALEEVGGRTSVLRGQLSSSV